MLQSVNTTVSLLQVLEKPRFHHNKKQTTTHSTARDTLQNCLWHIKLVAQRTGLQYPPASIPPPLFPFFYDISYFLFLFLRHEIFTRPSLANIIRATGNPLLDGARGENWGDRDDEAGGRAPSDGARNLSPLFVCRVWTTAEICDTYTRQLR